MKKVLCSAAIVAALSAPAFAGGANGPIIEGVDVIAPEMVEAATGSMGSSSGGGVLPILLGLGLLGLAASSGS